MAGSKDDRDLRKPLTPSRGVQQIIQEGAPIRGEAGMGAEEFPDELTPIEGTDLEQAKKRSASAAASSRQATKLIGEVRHELKEYAAADQLEHKEIRSELREINGHLSDVREGFGQVSGQLGMIASSLDRVHDDRKLERDFKMKARLAGIRAIWKVVAAVAAAAGVGLVSYLLAR